MWHKVVFNGLPGTGKTTCALSYPGVRQIVFGADEEVTALNFRDRTDIFPPLKLDWYETLKPEERAKFTDEKISELDIAKLTKIGRSRNVRRLRQYLYRTKDALLTGANVNLQTLVLDNLTPFSQEFEDYTETIWEREFITKEGGFDTAAYYKRFASELSDFLRLFMSLPCHTLVTCHIGMMMPEEVAAVTPFFQQAKSGGKREWLPLLTGKGARNAVASIPAYRFFLKTEESAGQASTFIAKLEADEANVGMATARIQPFENPRRICFPRNRFYETFQAALEEYLKTGVPVKNP